MSPGMRTGLSWQISYYYLLIKTDIADLINNKTVVKTQIWMHEWLDLLGETSGSFPGYQPDYFIKPSILNWQKWLKLKLSCGQEEN